LNTQERVLQLELKNKELLKQLAMLNDLLISQTTEFAEMQKTIQEDKSASAVLVKPLTSMLDKDCQVDIVDISALQQKVRLFTLCTQQFMRL
jgi:hypothetical protein